jgi:hypothetical protein
MALQDDLKVMYDCGVGSDDPAFGLGKNPSQEACMHFILVRVLACQAQVSCKGFFHF